MSQVDQVYSAIIARARGEVDNQEVESAVAELLGSTEDATKKGRNKKNTSVDSHEQLRQPQKQRESNQKGKGRVGFMRGRRTTTVVTQDEDDYDDIPSTSSKQAVTTLATKDSRPNGQVTSTQKRKWSGKSASLQSIQNEVATMEGHHDTDNQTKKLRDIPMGEEGSRIMVTFGDGKSPNHKAVETALLGTRKSLLVAIKDARALRRQVTREYKKAFRAMHMGDRKLPKKFRPTKTYTSEGVDPTLLYRSMFRNDSLCYTPKCGFDMEQIQKLFPEEMNAYDRWNDVRLFVAFWPYLSLVCSGKGTVVFVSLTQCPRLFQHLHRVLHLQYSVLCHTHKMHAAYESNRDFSVDGSKNDKEDSKKDDRQNWVGGHLQERAAHFDSRTDQMKEDWYLRFADVRQKGSFLPRRNVKKTTEERNFEKQVEVNEKRKTTQESHVAKAKNGSTTALVAGGDNVVADADADAVVDDDTAAIWEGMSFHTIRFLHWIGFDPKSDLPPPKDEVTHALAFLAHDFMGRIIEQVRDGITHGLPLTWGMAMKCLAFLVHLFVRSFVPLIV